MKPTLLSGLSTSLLTLVLIAAVDAPGADVEGSYTVPASDEMAEPMDVPLTRARLCTVDGVTELDYRLPKELDGSRPQRFRVTGTMQSAIGQLRDEVNGVLATCIESATAMTCHMDYSQGQFTVNTAAARVYLQGQGVAPARIEELQTASRVLEHQAVGIVTMPKDSCPE